jgi:Mg2+/Co2+ transporter CorB
MTLEIGLELAAIAVLLLLSAFFNASETSLTASSKARMHALSEEGNARAKLVNKLMSAPERMLGTVLLGNTLVDTLAAILAADVAKTLLSYYIGELNATVVATVLLTVLIVIFSAVLPKTYALAWADATALRLAPVMRTVIWLLTPLTMALQFVVQMLLKLTPNTQDDAANILAAREEIRGTIDLQTKEGTVERGDAEMLGGVLDLGDLDVSDIMIHRTKMESVDIDEPPETIIADVLKSQFTRVPLWRENPENIVGILNSKDMLAALASNGFNPSALKISELAQPPWFVPETTRARLQLNAFLRRKAQMALVVDEYGTVQGLVTLEDILEEIVGQISDEHDTPDAAIRPQVDGSVNVDGSVPVRDLNRHMNWSLPDEEATTVAGLVIHEAETIPEPGQAFTFYGFRFEVLRKSRNKITALRIRPLTSAQLAEGAPNSKSTPVASTSESGAMDAG